MDQLETILRYVADELESWHGRALKTEAELREHQGHPKGAGSTRIDPEIRNRVADLELENKQLRQRVEAARQRVGDLLGRLTFLEDQAREPGGNGGSRGSGPAGGGGTT